MTRRIIQVAKSGTFQLRGRKNLFEGFWFLFSSQSSWFRRLYFVNFDASIPIVFGEGANVARGLRTTAIFETKRLPPQRRTKPKCLVWQTCFDEAMLNAGTLAVRLQHVAPRGLHVGCFLSCCKSTVLIVDKNKL